MTLSTQRGTPRRTVLNALVAALRYSATIIPGDIVTEKGTGTGMKGTVTRDVVSDTTPISSPRLIPLVASVSTSVITGAGTTKAIHKEQSPAQEQGQSQGQGLRPEDPEMCSRRLRTLTRLAAMVTLVIKASGATGIVDPSSTTHTPQVTYTPHLITTNHITAHSSIPLLFSSDLIWPFDACVNCRFLM